MKRLTGVVVLMLLSLTFAFADSAAFDAKFKAQVKEAKAQLSVISLEEVMKMMEDGKKFFIVDVRDPDEVKSFGHPKWDDYKHMSRGKLEPSLSKSGLTVDDVVVVFCKTGARASLAGLTLKEYGFKTVLIADGGMDRWIEKGYPEAE